MMFCGNCSTKEFEGDRFCVTCGLPYAVTDPERSGAVKSGQTTATNTAIPAATVSFPSKTKPPMKSGERSAVATSVHGSVSAPATARPSWFRENKVLVGIGAGLIAVLLVVLV